LFTRKASTFDFGFILGFWRDHFRSGKTGWLSDSVSASKRSVFGTVDLGVPRQIGSPLDTSICCHGLGNKSGKLSGVSSSVFRPQQWPCFGHGGSLDGLVFMLAITG
jgi:hypothetical protein